MPFPSCLLTSPISVFVLDRGVAREFHVTSHLDHPHSAVKADIEALALTFCQSSSPQHDFINALLCSQGTIALGPILPKQKLSLSPYGQKHSIGGSLVVIHHGQKRTFQVTLYGYLESSVPTIYLKTNPRDENFFFYAMSHNKDMFTKRIFSKYVLKFKIYHKAFLYTFVFK